MTPRLENVQKIDFGELLLFYETHLRDHVMPFWLKHGIDPEHGGIFNFLDDDGRLRSSDKVLWSQARALWTFSALYNDFEQHEEWIEIARRIADFLMNNGREPSGAWAFRLSQDGRIIEPAGSIYVDAFAIYGLTEYARATGNNRAVELAVASFERTSPLLRDHSFIPTRPHTIPPGLQAHGPSMIFALAYHELGVLTGNQKVLDRALELAEVVMTQHLSEDDQVLYEFVRPGGGKDQSDAGKTFVPGHAVESLWFMERIYRFHNRQERIATAMNAICWHLEKGWDYTYGGIYLARHIENGKPAWHSPDSKLWWPITESLLALLRAYEVTGHSWCLDWYQRVHDYAFKYFPDREHGEWAQNLDRRGRRIPVVVADLPVKDPFHLPRALIYSILVLRRLAGRSSQAETIT